MVHDEKRSFDSLQGCLTGFYDIRKQSINRKNIDKYSFDVQKKMTLLVRFRLTFRTCGINDFIKVPI